MRTLMLCAILSLALLIPLGGCGGGGSTPPPPCTGSSCPPTSASDFLYESNSNQVFGFQVDATTGAVDSTLTPVARPALGGGLVITSNNFMYVADSGNNAVDGFSLDTSTGALTALSGFPVTVDSGQGAQGMAVDPAGKFLFVPQHNTNEVAAYTISSGQLTPVAGSPFATGGVFPVQAIVDPSGHFLYVANSLDPLGTISAFSIDSSTGVLTPILGSPFTTLINGGPSGMAVHPNGKFLYVGMVGAAGPTNQIVVESIDSATGALLPVSGSPFLTGSEPNGLAIDPAGKFLFSANAGDGTVSAFTIDSAGGGLTEINGSPYTAGVQPAFLVTNSTSATLYVLDAQSTTILAYTISSSGALTPVAPINGGGGATGLAIVHKP